MDIGIQRPVLVTGASGFIGGRLVRRLIERHCRVSCLVRGNSHIAELQSAGGQLVMGDVTDRGSVERALAHSQAGTVFHLAGLVKALREDDFMRVNAGGVETVTSASADRPCPPVLVIVSSLSAAGPCAADQPRSEEDVPAPVSLYGRSKLAGEQVAAEYAGAVPISIVRPPIVFGPGDKGMYEVFRPIADWGLHVVPGTGDQRFSLIHVDDLVEGLLAVAEKGERLREHETPAPGGQGIYFIAGENTLTYTQLGQAIAESLRQKSPAVVRLPDPVMRLIGIGGDVIARIRRRPGWIGSEKIAEALAGSWTCSSAKARLHLGWSPAATLADRLYETACWYRQEQWL